MPFVGDVYVTDIDGSIVSPTDAATTTTAGEEGTQGRRQQLCVHQGPSFATGMWRQFLLPHGVGWRYVALLFVIGWDYKAYHMVYKLDTVNKAFPPVISIGGRTMFVSSNRCQ